MLYARCCFLFQKLVLLSRDRYCRHIKYKEGGSWKRPNEGSFGKLKVKSTAGRQIGQQCRANIKMPAGKRVFLCVFLGEHFSELIDVYNKYKKPALKCSELACVHFGAGNETRTRDT